MKYLITIFSIIILATVVTFFFAWPEPQLPAADVAVSVNDHQFSRKDLDEQEAQVGYHHADTAELLDSVITRELLIQEARRLGIDREESFRKSLKTFYEQSLIKILTDRKYSEIKVDVSDEEIETYLSCFGKQVTFSRLPVTSSPPYKLTGEEGEQSKILFDDLAEPMRAVFASLKPGEYKIKFDNGSEKYAIRLDNLAYFCEPETALPSKDQVREILGDLKRQDQIGKWLDELRKSASITIAMTED